MESIPVPGRRRREDRNLTALWAEPAPRRPLVTRELLVHEALVLLNDVGFDGLTMRRLAERLGIQAASLYNHVHDKHELLTLLADAICGEIADLDHAQPWRAQLEASAYDLRRVLLAFRDAARVLVTTPPSGPNRMRAIEQVLAALRQAGLNDAAVADAGWVFNTFVTGFVLDETQGLPGGDGSEASLEQRRIQVEQWFKSLPKERYPTVVALADQLVDADMDRRFAFGLQLLLDGLEQRLAGRGSPDR